MVEKIIDPILEYYCKITQSSYLHYGYWNSTDMLTIENLHYAQIRYIDYLISLIPKQVHSILDVGCGIGGNALRLSEAGFKVESLSPDLFQAKRFIAKDKVPFHLSKFEDFVTSQKYDLIFMSESAQYIPIAKGFDKCQTLLKAKGFLLVSDYFLRASFEHNNVFVPSTHLNSEYLQTALDRGFRLAQFEDITMAVLPTLDLAKLKYKEYVEPTLELFDRLMEARISIPYQILKRLTRSYISRAAQQLQLLDSEQFLKHRQYMVYLFQNQ